MRAALFLALIPLPAFAQCPAGTEIFSCPSATKTIQICQTDTAAIYRFGPKANPDLTLTTPFTEIDATPWPGIGRTIWSEATFHNDGYSYTVWTAFDRLDETAVMEGGVTVYQGDTMVAQIACDAGKVRGDTSGLADARALTGQCWDMGENAWLPKSTSPDGAFRCTE